MCQYEKRKCRYRKHTLIFNGIGIKLFLFVSLAARLASLSQHYSLVYLSFMHGTYDYVRVCASFHELKIRLKKTAFCLKTSDFMHK